MKKILKKFTLLTLLLSSSGVFALQGLNVITITTDDPEGYLKWLTESQPVFQEAQGDDVLASGICSPVAGGANVNEHYVWNFAPSVSAMMSNPGFFTDKNVQRAIRKIASKREVTRRDLMFAIKSGSLMGFQIISESMYTSGYQNNGLMVLSPGAFIILGLIIWVQRSIGKIEED